MKRIYIAGPMSGIQDFNFPAFYAEAARLRALGYHVENPAENPVPPCGGSWEGYMRMAIAQLVTCHCVALLPGWVESRGALIEQRLANEIGIHTLPASEITA